MLFHLFIYVHRSQLVLTNIVQRVWAKLSAKLLVSGILLIKACTPDALCLAAALATIHALEQGGGPLSSLLNTLFGRSSDDASSHE